MTEAPAGDPEGAGRLLDVVRLVAGRLSVLHLRDLHVLAHFIEVLLGLLELPNVPGRKEREQKREEAAGIFSGRRRSGARSAGGQRSEAILIPLKSRSGPGELVNI